MYTEKEARNKICFRTFSPCQGSACMAWRWNPIVRNFVIAAVCGANDPAEAGERPSVAPVGHDWEFIPFEHIKNSGLRLFDRRFGLEKPMAIWAEPIEQARPRRFGHCGLIDSGNSPVDGFAFTEKQEKDSK